MSQPYPSVLGGRYSALEGGWQSNGVNGARLPSPTAYSGLAAWYDVSDSSSLTVDSSNRVKLVADKSGNSGVNCLCCNTSSGTIPATSPDSAAVSITGSIEMVIRVRFSDYTPASNIPLIYKYGAAGQRSWAWLFRTNGAMEFVASYDGTATVSSTGSVIAYTDLTAYWLRVTFNPSTGALNFFYAADTGSNSTIPSSWTTAGSVTLSTGTIFDSNAQIAIGGDGLTCLVGSIYRAAIYNGIAGTLVFDANFATASKLTTSFTESSSNAATVTINTSGDLGARISGERDLVQLTTTKQPIYLPWNQTNYGWLNGVVSSRFTTPDSASVSITGDIDVRAQISLASWTPATAMSPITKYVSGTQQSWYLEVRTGGGLRFSWSADGAVNITKDSTATTGFAAGTTNWIRATLDVDNGAAGNTVRFFTSADGVTWVQLGSDVVTAGTTSIFDSNSPVEVGSLNNGAGNLFAGRIFRAQVYNGINGTVVADFDPSLYTSGTTFTASTGETWTLNGGSTIVNRSSLYFDGSDDYMKAAAFSLSNPVSGMLVGQQISWTANDTFFSGNSASGLNIGQSGVSPAIVLYQGSAAASNSEWLLNSTAAVGFVFNGASSALQINRNTATTGNPGTATPNGFVLGWSNSGSEYANIRVSEIPLYSAALDKPSRDRLALYAGQKWNFQT